MDYSNIIFFVIIIILQITYYIHIKKNKCQFKKIIKELDFILDSPLSASGNFRDHRIIIFVDYIDFDNSSAIYEVFNIFVLLKNTNPYYKKRFSIKIGRKISLFTNAIDISKNSFYSLYYTKSNPSNIADNILKFSSLSQRINEFTLKGYSLEINIKNDEFIFKVFRIIENKNDLIFLLHIVIDFVVAAENLLKDS